MQAMFMEFVRYHRARPILSFSKEEICSSSDEESSSLRDCGELDTSRNEELAASGHQGSRNRPVQLIPEGLSPQQHLPCALEVEHPVSPIRSPGKSVEIGLRGALWDPAPCGQVPTCTRRTCRRRKRGVAVTGAGPSLSSVTCMRSEACGPHA